MNTEPQVNDFVEYKNEIYTIEEISPFTQFGENHTMYLLSLAGTLTNARIYEYHFKSGEATIISDPHRGNRSTVVYEYSAVRLKGGKLSFIIPLILMVNFKQMKLMIIQPYLEQNWVKKSTMLVLIMQLTIEKSLKPRLSLLFGRTVRNIALDLPKMK